MDRLCYKCGKALNSSNYCVSCELENSFYRKLEVASDLLYNRALEWIQLRDLSTAVEALEKSLKLNKRNIDARNLLGLVYYEMGETVEAIRQWVLSKNISGHDNLAEHYLSVIQNNQANLEKLNSAIEKYNQALKHIEQNSIDLAIIQLKKVTSIHSKFIKAQLLLGLCYFHEGHNNRAKKVFNKVAHIDKSNFLARRYLFLLSDHKVAEETEEKPQEVASYDFARSISDSALTSYGQQVVFIIIGVVVGLGIGLFLIAPTRINQVESEKTEINSRYNETKNDLDKMTNQYDTEKEAKMNLEKAYTALEVTAEEDKDLVLNLEKVLLAMQLSDSGDLLGAGEQLYLINDEVMEEHPTYNYMNDYRAGTAASLYSKGRNQYFIRSTNSYKESIRYFDLFIKLSPETNDTIEALYLMALAKYRTGDEQGALIDLKNYVENYPDGRWAAEAARYIDRIE